MVRSPVENWIAQCICPGGRLLPEELSAWQLARAQEVLAFARNNSRFYRNWPKDTEADWASLPFTSAADIASDPFAFLCVPQREVARIITLPSSGTRMQKRLFFSEDDMERTVDFFAKGMSTMLDKGQRVAVFMRDGPYSVPALLKEGVAQFGGLADAFWPVSGLDEAAQYAKGAHCIVGAPSLVRALACACPRLRPKTVLLSSDYVPEASIELIQSLWECIVLTHYGMTETAFGAGVQCMAREGFHLRDADLMLEIVHPITGQPLAPGDEGEIVITTLQKRAMPLIRYRTGDKGRMLEHPCPCGGILPRLAKVTGRVDDEIELGDGRVISIQMLDERLLSLPEIWDYHASITAGGRLTLCIYASSENRAALIRTITQRIAKLVRVLEVEFIDLKDWRFNGQKRRLALEKDES